MDYFQLDIDDIPVSFELIYKETLYTLTFRYNTYGDYFTVDLEDKKGVIAKGLKVIYGRNIFEPINYMENIPIIIPADEFGEYYRVSFVTFNNIMFFIEEDFND